MTSLTQLLWELQDLGHLSGYLCTIYHTLTTKLCSRRQGNSTRSAKTGKKNFGIISKVLTFCFPLSSTLYTHILYFSAPWLLLPGARQLTSASQ